MPGRQQQPHSPFEIQVPLFLLLLAPRLNSLLQGDQLLLLIKFKLGFFLKQVLLPLAVPLLQLPGLQSIRL